jgi:RimJ/RimL family protein N-acetyltransferase
MKLRKSSPAAVFKPLNGEVILGRKVNLREKKMSDVRNDYRWQSDPELAGLDAAPVLSMAFSVYLLDYTSEIHKKNPRRYPLAVDTLDGRHIGNCTFYDIDSNKGEAQLGIMIGEREYWDRGYGTDIVTTLADHAFRNANFNRIYLKTLDWNLRAQKCFLKCGFTPCGQLRRNNNTFVLMEITREQWEKRQGISTG